MPDLKPFEELSAEHLRLVLETGHIGIWELDLASGRASRNSHHDAIFGYDTELEDWTYDMFLSHVVPEQREKVDTLQQTAIESGDVWSFDCAICTVHGDKRWISVAGRPLIGSNGIASKIIGHVIDITETKRNEDRLKLLTEELNHRVRNMLAVIRSIVRLSSRNAQDIASFAKSLEGRVEALSRSHRLMVSDASETLTPSMILEGEFAAFPNLDERVNVEVIDECQLTGAIGQGLSLIFHELATNALKYGALSQDTGRVGVRIDRDGDRLEIQWRETGGPPVRPSPDAGFGSKLISDAIGSAGHVELRFEDHGVECDISLPVG